MMWLLECSNEWLHECMVGCRSDSVVAEIALGGLEKEDKELHQLDRAVFSKVTFLLQPFFFVAFFLAFPPCLAESFLLISFFHFSG